MIRRIYDEDEYYNFLQLAGMLIYAEAMEAMEAIKLYDPEEETWSIRRLFWYLVLGTPSLSFIILMATAAIKYIWN